MHSFDIIKPLESRERREKRRYNIFICRRKKSKTLCFFFLIFYSPAKLDTRMCTKYISRLFEQPAVHLFFITAAVIFGVGVRLSDCASVRIQVGAAAEDDHVSVVEEKSVLVISRGRDKNLESIETSSSSSSLVVAVASKTHWQNDTTSFSSSTSSRNDLSTARLEIGSADTDSLQSLSSSVSLKPKKRLAVTAKEIINSGSTGSERVMMVVDNGDDETFASSLIIAQCRATCLEKFVIRPENTRKFREETTAPTAEQKQDVDKDMHQFSPNLLRFKRANKLPPYSSLCLLNASSECLSIGGCQVACSFYEQILGTNGQTSVNMGTSSKEMVFGEAVKAKHESSVKILPGKITWPVMITFAASNDNGNGVEAVVPVVYVVMQEYPDRKWRQIAQTTESELNIPFELTGAMREKLRSVFVLAVSPDGLQTVYNSLGKTTTVAAAATATVTATANRRPKQLPFFENGKSEKLATKVAAASFAEETEKKNKRTATGNITAAAEAITITTAASKNNVSVVNANEGGSSDIGGGYTTQQTFEMEQSTTVASDDAVMETKPETSSADMIMPAANESLGGLRLVSLLRQNSLVIAEMRWNQIVERMVDQPEYLVTWEVTGGGLKGHLVTDSTSVTLSLWPDTTYKVQVEEFQQNLDFDGEQTTVAAAEVVGENDSTSRKSLMTLILDTSLASFPIARASALLGSKDTIDMDYEHDEDEFVAEDEEQVEEVVEEDEEEDTSKGKTFGQVLGVALASLVVVLAILSLVAFLLVKLRMISAKKKCMDFEECAGGSEIKANDCLSCCLSNVYVQQANPRLLAADSQDNLSFEETTFPYGSSPMGYVLRREENPYKIRSKFVLDTAHCSRVHTGLVQINMSDEHDDEYQQPVFSVAMISTPELLEETANQNDNEAESKGASCSLFDSYFNSEFQGHTLTSSTCNS